MPDGPISYNTPANRDWDSFEPAQLDADAPTLVAGDNVLAVEVHQVTLASPDLTLSLKLLGVLPDRPRPRLTVRLVEGNLEVNWSPEGGTLESADDPSGAWTPVLDAHPPGQYLTLATDSKRFYRVAVP